VSEGTPPAAEAPLRVDWLDATAFDDGRDGRLGMTFLPGKRGASMRYPGRVYRRELDADLETLAGLGIWRLLLLVEDDELHRWGDPDLVERAAARGIDVERHPTPDGEPPASSSQLAAILAWLRAARRDGDVAVACMGGVGRTGTVAACALVEAGWSADAAIAEVRRVRHPTAVETPAQEAFVRAVASRRP
jgi:protein-tyrosine phosphatase